MENLTTKILFFTLSMLLTACSSSPDDEANKVPDKSAQALFVDAKKALDDGSYEKAIQILSAIDTRYPYGPISHQVQLDLVYAYYKSNQTVEGIALADRFIKLNPGHPSLDYVYYMRGLIYLATEDNLFQSLLNVDRSDRDPTAAKNAFNDFKTILNEFPDSKYVNDSRLRMVAIKSRLARYELAAAQYYIKRKAWASAVNRGRYVVEYFPNTPEVEQALEIMVQCYDKLGLNDLKINAQQVLTANYPKNKTVN